MFEEESAVLEELHTHVTTIKRIAIFGGDYFLALALVAAYNNLIALADERTQTHPEVQRVPSLRTILLDHLLTHADKHINIQRGTIFDDGLLGGPNTLAEWQDAGYHTRRSTSNYQSRLRYWQAIYDNAPVVFQQRVNTPGEIFNTQRTYQATFLSPKGKIPGRPVNKYKKAIVTYEDVIRDRDQRYNATAQLVPWWRALNYGTGGKGYPVSPGLHFIEDAEREVPNLISRYSDYFEEFMGDTFGDDTITQDDILTVESWAYRNIKPGKEYISSFDLARIISFGVPF